MPAARVALRSVQVLIALALLGGLAWLAGQTHHYVLNSPYFSVGQATVLGHRQVSAEEIQQLSGLEPGTNIFAVSPSEAGRRIVAHPWVAQATVRRRLPCHLTIEVQEREAVALVKFGQLFLVDAGGHLFKPFEVRDAVDLPVITGVDREGSLDKAPGAHDDLAEALALVQLYEESGLGESHPLSEVHLEQDGTLSVYTLEQGTRIRLGRPPFRRRLRRLARLLRELHSRQAVADYVYLEEGDDHVQPPRAVVRLRR
jgi:cell division protein FtsQ